VFVKAIEIAAAFTRPLYFISRHYGSKDVHPGAATLFLVNADGWALTCAHVAREVAAVRELPDRLRPFREALSGPRQKLSQHKHEREVARRFKITADSVIDLKCSFIGCVDTMTGFELRVHSSLDIALIHFQGFKQLLCDSFPIFPRNAGELKQGLFLCRLGFPFPEFTHFEWDSATDSIRWTTSGKSDTPRFPIEGMVTRHLADANASIVGFELSTPGLRGQSGGPAFDTDGRVWGMQSATNHLDLDFDVDMKVKRGGHVKSVQESAFLHVGHCVHAEALKEFMRSNGVAFAEG
jgi:hypothetical protein